MKYFLNLVADSPPHVLVMRVTAVFWMMSKIISFKLWIADRYFPLIPPFDFLSGIPSWIHLLLFAISIICMVCIIAFPQNYFLITTAFIAEIASCILDQNRWQPWEYQYVCFLLIFILNQKNIPAIASLVLIILSSTYFYSGLSKLNSQFIPRIWEWFLTSGILKLEKASGNYSIIKAVGYTVPFIEIIAGIALLFNNHRKWACLVLIVMHVIILIILGPAGLNFNKVVWPWNTAMICYLVIFSNRFHYNFFLPTDIIKQNWVIIICWVILPAFSFINYWDNYLSSNLYSGRTKNALLCMRTKDGVFPKELINLTARDPGNFCPGGKIISLTNWSMNEVKVPCYPEKRIFFGIEKILKERYSGLKFTMLYRE